MTASSLAVPLLMASAGDVARPASRLRDDDREAVEACLRGERAAFDRLVERYQRDVYRLCYRYVNNHHDASDLAQEVFLKAYRALGRFRGDSSFSTWLYRISVNACLNFRALRRLPSAELPDQIADHGAGAHDHLERDERSRQVREAVTRLPDRQRATLILKVFHDLTHEEVAGILGTSVGTVKANLFHALANLRKLLVAEVGR
jgi:RNA polymerase sigma-70 factor (ECF subfamily)